MDRIERTKRETRPKRILDGKLAGRCRWGRPISRRRKEEVSKKNAKVDIATELNHRTIGPAVPNYT